MKNKVKILLENILKETAQDRSNRPKIKLRAMWQDREERRIKQFEKILQQEVIDGDLNLQNEPIENLGNIRRVKGDLIINSCRRLSELPEGLIVEGNLWMGYTYIKKLPNYLLVRRVLDLEGCYLLEDLPEEMIVGGAINASGTSDELIKKLKIKFPKNTIVSDYGDSI